MRGLVWSHLLASICGGLLVAGVLLAFGVIGKQRTETVPIAYAPPTTPGSPVAASNTEQLYLANAPGVVSIHANITERVASPFLAGSEAAPSTSTGSGFLVSEKAGHGYILTCFHVIEGAVFAHGITVQFNADSSRRAKVIEYDQTDDVALLSVAMAGVSAQIRPLRLGNSRHVAIGDSTLALANPFGAQRTLSSGLIASLQPRLNGVGGSIDGVFETDSATGPGTSGGPLLDANGAVIGVNSQIEVNSGGSDYLVGFAVPINTVRAEIIPKGVL